MVKCTKDWSQDKETTKSGVFRVADHVTGVGECARSSVGQLSVSCGQNGEGLVAAP